MYQKYSENNEVIYIKLDGMTIPVDDGNRHYKTFKLWLKENKKTLNDLPELNVETTEQTLAKLMPGRDEKLDALYDAIANKDNTKLDAVKTKIVKAKEKLKESKHV